MRAFASSHPAALKIRARKSRSVSTGMVIVSGDGMLALAQCGHRARKHAYGQFEVFQIHGFIWIMAAVLVAHENHRSRNANGSIDRGIMTSTARHLDMRDFQLSRGRRETIMQIAIHF